MTTNRQATPQRQTAGVMPRLLTLRDVTAATALSRSAVYALMAESRFPKPIRIGSALSTASSATAPMSSPPSKTRVSRCRGRAGAM